MSRARGLILSYCTLLGCQTVVSINPIVPDSAAIIDPRLVGTWLNLEDSSRTVVTVAGKSYTLKTSEEGQSEQVWQAHLGRLDRYWLLDVHPPGEGVEGLRIPGHLLLLVEFLAGDQQLRVAAPDGDSLAQYLHDGRLGLPYLTLSNGDIVLTASTQQLTSALGGYLARPGVLTTAIAQRVPNR